MPRRQFFNALNHRVRRWNVVQSQEAVQTIHVEPPVNCRVSQNRLDFRAENDVIAGSIEIKRFDSHAIPRESHPLLRLLPDSECEHSTQLRKTLRTPLP